MLTRVVFVPEILQTIVKEQEKGFPFVDETDLYFGYHYLFQDKFQLLKIDDLSHLAYTDLSEETLQAATERVEAALGNEDALHAFLMTQEVWLEALKGTGS